MLPTKANSVQSIVLIKVTNQAGIEKKLTLNQNNKSCQKLSQFTRIEVARPNQIQPIKNIVLVAEAVSTGDMTADFDKKYNDEIGSLVEAFTRMKLSLAMAIKRFERNRKATPKSDS
jgi:methyl-accepting chemotaxis protein